MYCFIVHNYSFGCHTTELFSHDEYSKALDMVFSYINSFDEKNLHSIEIKYISKEDYLLLKQI